MGGLKLELFRQILLGAVQNQHVFPNAPIPGPSPFYVICNSVPKSGTYLLVELVKALGGHVDIGYHTYTSSISKVHDDGSFDFERAIPAALWTSAFKPGHLCASHTEYCPHLEQYLLSRPQHKMLFIVRDPRDLVISWVDFVYQSAAYPKMRKWNAYAREAGKASHPDDVSQITSTILSLPQSGILNFMSWLDSPACLTVKFEDLYSELTADDPSVTVFPVLDRICDYLEVARRHPSELNVLGRGLTSSGRAAKIGVYKDRMTADHLDLLRTESFQRLVVEYGYEPTPFEKSVVPTVPDEPLDSIRLQEVQGRMLPEDSSSSISPDIPQSSSGREPRRSIPSRAMRKIVRGFASLRGAQHTDGS